jgi:hypothetical protein
VFLVLRVAVLGDRRQRKAKRPQTLDQNTLEFVVIIDSNSPGEPISLRSIL